MSSLDVATITQLKAQLEMALQFAWTDYLDDGRVSMGNGAQLSWV